MNNANYVPKGYQHVTPYLTVRGVAELVGFLKATFDATEKEILIKADGSIHHAEMMIGESVIMMGEAGGEWKPNSAALYVYVPDTDATYKRALENGAKSLREPADQFYGDRSGGVIDQWGNSWWLATHKQDVSVEEMQKHSAKT